MKLILDLDTGIDDALALAFALASPEVELIGVTGTYGNVDVRTGVANTRFLLDMLGRGDIAVYPGVEAPGFEPSAIAKFIHGQAGLGESEAPAHLYDVEGKTALEFIAQSLEQWGDELVIVPTGALTSIAGALEAVPALRDTTVVFMGGALTVPGNVSPLAEANASQDPAAVANMLKLGTAVSMVGLDVTLKTLLTTEYTSQWRDCGEVGVYFADLVDFYIKAYETTAPGLGGCGLHDPLAVAAAFMPQLVTWLDINLTCEPTGRTIADMGRWQEAPVHRAAVDVRAEEFVELFHTRLMDLFARLAHERL